jgi:hypothetical protein
MKEFFGSFFGVLVGFDFLLFGIQTILSLFC